MEKGTCRHYRGSFHNKCCEAGVHLRELVGGPDHGWVRRLPCLKKMNAEYETVTCSKYEEPTKAEIAEDKKWVKEQVARMKKTIPLIERIKKENEGKTTKGITACPVCKGKLHWTHAASNGHVWGKCETEDCLAWME